MIQPDLHNNLGFSKLVFEENFNTLIPDHSKWNIRVTGKQHNLEEQAYINSDETIYVIQKEDKSGFDGYALAIHPRYRPGYRTPDGEKYDFVSGRLDTRGKLEFVYGLISARMKLPSGHGLWPAFWLLGEGQWPKCGEIDIMENVGEASWISSAVHGSGYSGDGGLVNSFYFPGRDDATSWHEYSAALTPEMISFFVDGVLVNRITKPMVSYFGQWIFDNQKHVILNFAVGGTYPYKTNGIQAPYLGLPQATVEKIKNNRVKALVDWVRVYQ